jgi:hypothetical protein
MLVTGVQAVGAKGMTAIQGTVVDIKEATRAGVDGDREGDHAAGRRAKAGEPQPVVFPRSNVAIDRRPVAMRQEHAATRYRSDGGDADHDDAA